MAVALAGVFGGNVSVEAAKALAFSALKKTALQQPAKLFAKELSKLIPGLGQVVAEHVDGTIAQFVFDHDPALDLALLVKELDGALQRSGAGKRMMRCAPMHSWVASRC